MRIEFTLRDPTAVMSLSAFSTMCQRRQGEPKTNLLTMKLLYKMVTFILLGLGA